MENVNLKLETLVQHRTSATLRLCDDNGMVVTMNTITMSLYVRGIIVAYVDMIENTHRATIFSSEEYGKCQFEIRNFGPA
jgi:hypothetical protein